MITMQYYMHLKEQSDKTKSRHTGAKLPSWLNSMVAGLPKYKDGGSRASSTDNVFIVTKVSTYTKQ